MLFGTQRFILFLPTLLLVAAMASLTRGANVTVYSNSGQYNAAVASTTATINFEGIAAPGNAATLSILQRGGVTFTGTNNAGNNIFFVTDSAYNSTYAYGSGAMLQVPDSFPGNGGFLTATLPGGGATAVGMNLMSQLTATDGFSNPLGVTGRVTFIDGLTQTFVAPTFARSAGAAFFGITSDTAILSVRFSGPGQSGNVPLIDNFTYGTRLEPTNPVPEPATMFLLSSGLWGLGLKIRSKRKA